MRRLPHTLPAPHVPAKYLPALDALAGKTIWEIPNLGGGILASGLMSTAGGLVFDGDSPGGAFIAADAMTGRLLWHFNTGQSCKAGPMTYAVDETQYIGVAAGSRVMTFALP